MLNRRVHGRYSDWDDYRLRHQFGTSWTPDPDQLDRAIHSTEIVLSQCTRPDHHPDTTPLLQGANP